MYRLMPCLLGILALILPTHAISLADHQQQMAQVYQALFTARAAVATQNPAIRPKAAKNHLEGYMISASDSVAIDARSRESSTTSAIGLENYLFQYRFDRC